MLLIRKVIDDLKAARSLRRLRWRTLLFIFFASLPTYWLFDHFGRLALALPTLNGIVVFGVIIAVKRDLTGRLWFWITLSILAALHAPLILFVPWTNKWVPALLISGIDSVDICMLLWILAAVGSLVDGSRSPEA